MIENPKVSEKYSGKKPNCNRDCTHCKNSVYIRGLGMDIYQMCCFELATVRDNINDYLRELKENKDDKDGDNKFKDIG